MPNEDKTFSAALVLDLRIWLRHVHALYINIIIIGSLSTRVFETRTATGREHFTCQDRIVSQIFILLISNWEKILSNVNVVVWEQAKSENSSSPFAVRTSKTRLLKLHITTKTILSKRKAWLTSSVVNKGCILSVPFLVESLRFTHQVIVRNTSSSIQLSLRQLIWAISWYLLYTHTAHEHIVTLNNLCNTSCLSQMTWREKSHVWTLKWSRSQQLTNRI